MRFGVKVSAEVKSHGVGMAAGTRRNVKVARKRLHDFRSLIHKFRKLKAAAVREHSSSAPARASLHAEREGAASTNLAA